MTAGTAASRTMLEHWSLLGSGLAAMTAYQMLTTAHVMLGTGALGAFWAAALLRKGSPLHRTAGKAFLLAMTAILATALPMAAYKWSQGHPVTAVFLAYLVIITATSVWTAWRAIRDQRDIVRYTGPVYVALALWSLASGVGVLALGLRIGAPLLVGFSLVGMLAGLDMLHKRLRRERLARHPRWWLREHYTAMLGNGIATHIAFLGIGLPRLLPAVDGAALHYLAWFGPLLVAGVAKLLLDRRWPSAKTRVSTSTLASTSPDAAKPVRTAAPHA